MEVLAPFSAIKTGMQAAIAQRLGAGVGLVQIEAEVIPDAEMATPWVGIYGVGFTSAETISVGRRALMTVMHRVEVAYVTMESIEQAAARRDLAVSQVISGLMADSTLGGICEGLLIDGGAFMSARNDQGLGFLGFASLDVAVRCRVAA